jgi:hypothetical protein
LDAKKNDGCFDEAEKERVTRTKEGELIRIKIQGKRFSFLEE